MNKFAKVSASIIIVILVFIGINKLIFNERISAEDYKNIYDINTDISIDRYEETNDGVLIKMKIKNNSNYTYRLENASITFFSCKRSDDNKIIDSREAFKLNILPIEFGEENDITWTGIEPKEEGYIEFLYPKGIKIDDKFFDLDATSLNYNGTFSKDLPIGDGAYTTITWEEKEILIKDLGNKIIERLRGE